MDETSACEAGICGWCSKLSRDELCNSRLVLMNRVGVLEDCVDAGRAAHNEERVARDQLARRVAELEGVLRDIANPSSFDAPMAAARAREALGGPYLPPLAMVEDQTLEQRIEDGDACTCLTAFGALCPVCHAGYGR